MCVCVCVCPFNRIQNKSCLHNIKAHTYSIYFKSMYMYIVISFNILYINIRGVNVNVFFTQINHIIRFDPNLLPTLQRGRLSVVCDEVQRLCTEQCCQGSGTTSGQFCKYRKITEPWVAFFWGYFYNVPQPPKVYIDKLKIDPFTVYYTWNIYLAT